VPLVNRRAEENKYSMVLPNKTVAETIVSSHIGRVKRGWNTVRRQFASIMNNPTSVNAAAYEETEATSSLRIFARTTSNARFTHQQNKKAL
jgi:hypothetical protein